MAILNLLDTFDDDHDDSSQEDFDDFSSPKAKKAKKKVKKILDAAKNNGGDEIITGKKLDPIEAKKAKINANKRDINAERIARRVKKNGTDQDDTNNNTQDGIAKKFFTFKC